MVCSCLLDRELQKIVGDNFTIAHCTLTIRNRVGGNDTEVYLVPHALRDWLEHTALDNTWYNSDEQSIFDGIWSS